jgi:signal transduction histidine kinase
MLESLFEELFVVDLRGQVIASSEPTSVGKVLKDKEYFEGLFEQAFVSAPFYDVTQQTMRVVVSAPLMSPEGRTVGSLAGLANLGLLDRLMAERTGLGSTGDTYLVGRNLNLITSSRTEGRNEGIKRDEVSKVLAGKGTLVDVYRNEAGVDMIATFRWIDSLKVVLVAEQEQTEAFASALKILGTSLWIEGAFLILALAVSYRVGRSLARPLDDLANTALKIAQGAFELQATEDGPWEVSLLGRAFNSMTGRLKALIDELTDYKGHLEELVDERTADLEKALERAQDSDRLKSAFLATMSHELRTPLNSIIGFTGILTQGLVGPLNDEQKKQLGFVMTSARHLLALISDILDISKIEAGELRLENHPYDLPAVVAKAVKSVEPLAEKKKLSLTCHVEPASLPLVGDPRRVEQVLLNLLSNAVKFTDHGGVNVTVQVNGASVELNVADTGHGIQAEDLPKLFRPFQQLDAGLNRLHEGTGLGLSICKRLVDLMGGTIGVESELGAGSVFRFSLPLSSGRPA